MAKDEKTTKSDRQLRWEKLWADYAKRNPEKYAAKRATTYTEMINGVAVAKPKKDEMETIPDSFV